MLDGVRELFAGLGTKHALMMVVDIVLVYYLVYRVLLLIKGTKAVQILVGLTLLILAYFLSKEQFLHLETLNWLLTSFISSFVIIIIVLFQEDIRRALAQVGRNPLFYGQGVQAEHGLAEEIIKACSQLTAKGLGALLVIEQEADLSSYGETGVRIDAAVTKELLFDIFLPTYGNRLHDGAVVIQSGRIAFAGAFLPLTMRTDIDQSYGTRHRAAIGLSEETDAIVVVVSEETRYIAIVQHGELSGGLDANELRAELQKLARRDIETRSFVNRLRGLFPGRSRSLAVTSEDEESREDARPL